jgi:hypothetical protein
MLRPVQKRIQGLSQRINADVDRWIRLGQQEEARSRDLARVAVPDVVDEVLEYLAENPDLRDLIQEQSVGLAGEVVNSMREVTVTADDVLERVVRHVLRRQPRPSDMRLEDTHTHGR